MKTRPGNRKSIWVLKSVFGILLFFVLYFIAAALYPGGSAVDKNSIGFSWTNNYWCNLLDENAINGKQNPAKPVALVAGFVLCLTLSLFWYFFPKRMNVKKALQYTIQVSGIISMIIALFLFVNDNHDLIVNLASSFGLIATLGTIAALYKTKWYGLFIFGLLNVLLAGLNNYLYYGNGPMIWLPLVQKISFISFLLWFCCIDVHLFYRDAKPGI